MCSVRSSKPLSASTTAFASRWSASGCSHLPRQQRRPHDMAAERPMMAMREWACTPRAAGLGTGCGRAHRTFTLAPPTAGPEHDVF